LARYSRVIISTFKAECTEIPANAAWNPLQHAIGITKPSTNLTPAVGLVGAFAHNSNLTPKYVPAAKSLAKRWLTNFTRIKWLKNKTGGYKNRNESVLH
jgi:hypothetical protein